MYVAWLMCWWVRSVWSYLFTLVTVWAPFFPFLPPHSLPPFLPSQYLSHLLNPIKIIFSGWEPLPSLLFLSTFQAVLFFCICGPRHAHVYLNWVENCLGIGLALLVLLVPVSLAFLAHLNSPLLLTEFFPLLLPLPAQPIAPWTRSRALPCIHFPGSGPRALYPLLTAHLLPGTTVFRVDWCCCFPSVTIAYPYSLC